MDPSDACCVGSKGLLLTINLSNLTLVVYYRILALGDPTSLWVSLIASEESITEWMDNCHSVLLCNWMYIEVFDNVLIFLEGIAWVGFRFSILYEYFLITVFPSLSYK